MRNDELRDKVLDQEPYPGELEARIQEEMSQTWKRPLKPWERPLAVVFFVAVVAMLVGFMVFVGGRWDIILSRAPWYVLAALGMTVALAVLVMASLVVSVRSNTDSPRLGAVIVYGVAGMILFMAVCQMLTNTPMRANDLVGLIVAGTMVVCVQVYTAELRTRERLLRNELAILKLTEMMRDSKGEEEAPRG